MLDLKAIATQMRRDIVRMVHAVQSGHPGGSLGCVEYFTALYFQIMQHNPRFTMEGKNEDLFFLSNGHISPVFYSTLARSGYFDVAELASFRKLNSRLQGHPTTHEHLPGVRIASGSLGQGMSVAAGAAFAKKMDKEETFVYSLHGDGELQEGQNWEAALFAVHHKLDNYIATIDRNGEQIDGPTEKIMHLGSVQDKFESFGWEVLELENGNDIDAVIATLNKAKSLRGNGKPKMIIMHTKMGSGISFMEGSNEWHGIAPNDVQLQQALSELPSTLSDY